MKVCAQCPAADLLDGPPISGPSVICRAMLDEAGKTDEITHGRSATPLVTSQRDPSTFYGFCVGLGLPRVGDSLDRPHGHYTFCPVWELEKKRIWARRDLMKAPKRRGVSAATEAVLTGTVRDIDRGDAIDEWLAEERA